MGRFSPDPGPTPDAELVEAMGRGDVSAFEELYQRHRDWVYRLAWRFTGNEPDALDVLQETFTYLLQKAPRLQLWVRLSTFLYPVVKNIAITLRRRRGRSAALDTVPEPAAPLSPGPCPFELGDLASVLRVLPELHREVLLMRVVDDMTLEEIAVALDIPLGTVKSRLHNALAKLREDERTQEYFSE